MKATRVFKESIKVKTNDGVYRFAFYNANNLETTFLPNTDSNPADSHAIFVKSRDIKVLMLLKAKIT